MVICPGACILSAFASGWAVTTFKLAVEENAAILMAVNAVFPAILMSATGSIGMDILITCYSHAGSRHDRWKL